MQTGTLTEDGLDMWGVVPVADRKFQVPIKCVEKMDHREEFLVGMVTCHFLTIIDSKLSGDPLDLKVSPVIIDCYIVFRSKGIRKEV